MPFKDVLYELPEDLRTVPNPAQRFFMESCTLQGFEYPKRVVMGPKEFTILDRYQPIPVIDRWRNPKPISETFEPNATYSLRMNTFFESAGSISRDQELQRSAHETAHAAIQCVEKALDMDLNHPQFDEGLAEWVSCEVLNRSRLNKANKDWHRLILEWREEKLTRARMLGGHESYISLIEGIYLPGYMNILEVMNGIFGRGISVVDQLRFLLANYDPAIVGTYHERRDYQDYARELWECVGEESISAIA
jgi:hypothetical protein